MIDVEGNLWTYGDKDPRYRALVVTTNGSTHTDGRAIMGAGVAREAAELMPFLKERLGGKILAHGNNCYIWAPGIIASLLKQPWWIIAMPTKDDVRDRSTMARVTASIMELDFLVRRLPLQEVIIPRPGCGFGGLNYEIQVRPMLKNHLPPYDLYKIITFPKEPT